MSRGGGLLFFPISCSLEVLIRRLRLVEDADILARGTVETTTALCGNHESSGIKTEALK